MKVDIYVEGGARGQKELKIECQKAFHELFGKMGLRRNPAVVACGSRSEAFDRFKTALRIAASDKMVALLIDSEDPVTDHEKTWEHLKHRPGDEWEKPVGAKDQQVLFMSTCMETWIVADRTALRQHYGTKLKENQLPPLDNLENRHRHAVQEQLERATKDCSNCYAKGKKSFLVLATVSPAALRNLTAFTRMERILAEKLR